MWGEGGWSGGMGRMIGQKVGNIGVKDYTQIFTQPIIYIIYEYNTHNEIQCDTIYYIH